jgi:hypothetical protein
MRGRFWCLLVLCGSGCNTAGPTVDPPVDPSVHSPVGPSTGPSAQPSNPPGHTPGTFTLDLEPAGPPIISHNAALVFPLDLSARNRVAVAMGPATAFEVQTKSVCDSDIPPSDLNNNVHAVEASSGALPVLAAQDVDSIALVMPYRIPQDDYVRVADGLCVAVRPAGSQDFVFVPGRIAAVHDETAKIANAVLPVNQTGIDAIAVLFETTSAIRKITLQIR